MANSTANLRPEVWAMRGLLTLRENAVMYRYVTRDYENELSSYGDTVNIHGPSSLSSNSKTIGGDYTVQDITSTQVQLVLNKHEEATFNVDKTESAMARRNIFELQAPEAAKALANALDIDILGEHPNVTGEVGTAGTDLTATMVRTAIEEYDKTQVAPLDDQVTLVVHPKDWWNLMGDTAYTQANFLHAGSASETPIISGFGAETFRYGVRMVKDHNVIQVAGTPTTTHNLLFHRQGLAVAVRPLNTQIPAGTGATVTQVADPVSGLALTVTTAYDFRGGETQVTYEALWGHKTIQAALGVDVLS